MNKKQMNEVRAEVNRWYDLMDKPEWDENTTAMWAMAEEIVRLRHQLQGVWAIANLLATRLENISSGNAAVLHQFDREVEKSVPEEYEVFEHMEGGAW